MTYQTPDEWPLPPRFPQHAAPFGTSGRLRTHAQRALRLFIAAGGWAAGLCLIIGSIALVAGTARSAPARLTPAATGRQLSAHRHPGRSRVAGRADRVLRIFAGNGNKTTALFAVATHSRWELQWLYHCAPGAPGGHLIIREGDVPVGGVSVDAAGIAGEGSAWSYAGARRHYFVVITNCAWTAKVLGRR